MSDWQKSHHTTQNKHANVFLAFKKKQTKKEAHPNPGGKPRFISGAVAMKGFCVDKLPLPCKAVLEMKPLVLSWVASSLKTVRNSTIQPELFHEGWLCLACGTCSHCSAQAPCPHALTHGSDANWASHPCLMICSNYCYLFFCLFVAICFWFFVITKVAFHLKFFSLSQVLAAFAKCRLNSFKEHPSPPSPPFPFLNHTETNIVSKLFSAFKHSFTLSVSILLHACQSHLLLSVDKTKLALLRNNTLFWELCYFLNIVQISCTVNWQ